MKCDNCGRDFKNVSVHKRFCGKTKENNLDVNLIVVDQIIKEKPLSELVSTIKELIKRYRNQITTKISEKDGKIVEIEITARIQP